MAATPEHPICAYCGGSNTRRAKAKYCSAACRNRRWREANPEKIAANKRKHREANPEKVAAQTRKHVSEYYKKNREKVKAQQRKYRKENREKLAAQQRKYRKENHEKVEAQKREYRKENREKLAAARRRWREANPERYRASSVAGTQRRRAREENARQDGHTADDLARYWAAVGYAGCFLKGPTCNGRYEHIDHYVPLARGGEHTVENLVPACSRCNQAKHAKLMEEWRSSW